MTKTYLSLMGGEIWTEPMAHSKPIAEPLAATWRRQFIDELNGKIARARWSAASANSGGWYRAQIEEAIRMYEAARDAAASTGDTNV